jgi:2-haloacid dehalogenase
LCEIEREIQQKGVTVDTHATTTSRRHFLRLTTSLAASTLTLTFANAQPASPIIKAVAFDALAIFDPRSVFHLAEELFPGHGEELSTSWRTRQFEYTWLRNSMHQYKDFWHVTQDALVYAANQCNIKINPAQATQLMSAYLRLKPWPDVPPLLQTLRKCGIRLALLSNFTPTMMESCVMASGLESQFEFQLSTDQVQAFKPDPVAYALATQSFHLQKEQIVFVAFGAWDAAGAKSFGYPTYWANRTSVPAEELGVRPDAAHQDLSQLLDFIRSKNG